MVNIVLNLPERDVDHIKTITKQRIFFFFIKPNVDLNSIVCYDFTAQWL